MNDTINNILENPNKRGYRFYSNTSEVANQLFEIYTNSDDKSVVSSFLKKCEIIAQRLLNSEIHLINTRPAMQKPRKGSLIITFNVDFYGEFSCVLAKIDSEDFLSEQNFERDSGFLINEPALKTAIIKFVLIDDDEVDLDLVVADTSSSIADYWTNNFLESKEMTSDQKNTRLAFQDIELIISKNLKKQAPADYTELRNNLVGYFKNQENFHFDRMIDHVFGNYTMENDKVTIDHIKDKVTKLKEKENFDTQFKLIPSEITARFKKTYPLTDEIELRTNGHVRNLKHIIRAEKKANGQKIIEIKVNDDEVFKQFNFKNDD
ncbi:hypothetical protein FLK61_35335 [Paenalkalicoccus suaedae]|uniref:Nucleoid-associated protein n=1 Tax=Paenalkalicoccus suaedae TaxID=2592382 RepID=A0A859FF23_9BACI|nr:hypothetical protein FLK61_35335 [Paenalkalicoccus suaedae]